MGERESEREWERALRALALAEREYRETVDSLRKMLALSEAYATRGEASGRVTEREGRE